MNSLLADAGLASWKPVVTALLLPPVPLLLLVLAGAVLLWRRRAAGWLLVLLAVAGLWFAACAGTARLLERALLPAPAFGPAQLASLRQSAAQKRVAIVVLGGGREGHAPEYGGPSLSVFSLERLRYGVWLGRASGAPVAFSGGVGWGQRAGPAEATIAAHIAAEEYGLPLRWSEGASQDTRANARSTVELLQRAGIGELVLVTHGWHMRRALRSFEQAGAGRLAIVAAPVGLAPRVDHPLLEWMPTHEGHTHMRLVLRELAGLLAGS